MKTNNKERINRLENEVKTLANAIDCNQVLSDMDMLIKAQSFDTLAYYLKSLIEFVKDEGVYVSNLVDLLTITNDHDFGFASICSQPNIGDGDSAALWALAHYSCLRTETGYRVLRNLNK